MIFVEFIFYSFFVLFFSKPMTADMNVMGDFNFNTFQEEQHLLQ